MPESGKNNISLLIFGDVYGRLGRKALKNELPKLRAQYQPNFVIANIENITSGRGPISEHAQFVEDLGVDVMTSGDHIYDCADKIFPYLSKPNSKLIRPANFYNPPHRDLAGEGYTIVEKNGIRILVLQLIGEVFMQNKVYNPFFAAREILEKIPRECYDISVLDFHRETTAEIYAMTHYMDGKIGCIYGTHTHVQTHDARIMPGGTALLGDVGMNGPYHGVIGASFESVQQRFLSGIQRGKIEQELQGPYMINAVYVEIDRKNHCQKVELISYHEE